MYASPEFCALVAQVLPLLVIASYLGTMPRRFMSETPGFRLVAFFVRVVIPCLITFMALMGAFMDGLYDGWALALWIGIGSGIAGVIEVAYWRMGISAGFRVEDHPERDEA